MTGPGPALGNGGHEPSAGHPRTAGTANRALGIATATLVLLTAALLLLVPLLSATRSLAQRQELDRLVQAAGVPALIEQAAAERRAPTDPARPDRWTEPVNRARETAAALAATPTGGDAAAAIEPLTDVPGGIDAARGLLGAIDEFIAACGMPPADAGESVAGDPIDEVRTLAVDAANRLVGMLRRDFARELAGRLRFDGGVLAAVVLLGLLMLALFVRLRRLNAGLIEEIDRRIRGEQRLREQEVALRRAADELRMARDEARQADRAKSRFLATMSHEFRTPLNGILGFSWLIERGLRAGRTDAALEDVRRIRGAGEHMLRLVSDVLDLARLEADMMTATAADFDPDALLRDIADAARPAMGASGTTLECDLPPLGPACTDATRLRQVIDNLLSNAGRFTEGGRVHLSARRLAAGSPVPPATIAGSADPATAAARHAVGVMPSPDRPRLLVRVADTGPGMSPAQLAAAFGEFVQVDDSPQRRHGGSGLGLSLVSRLAPLLGGGVLLESRIGHGTTATLVVPVTLDSASHSSPPTREPRP